VKSPTPLPQKTDTKLMGNAGVNPGPRGGSDINCGGYAVASSGHQGGSNCCNAPTATLTRPPWLGEVALQELPQPAVESHTRSSQMSDIKSTGNAGGSSGHKGASKCCSTTKADMPPRGYGEVTLQAQPVAVSRIRSSRSGMNSRHRGRSDRCTSTPTKAETPPGGQERKHCKNSPNQSWNRLHTLPRTTI
jgi:hypothetical protein